MTAIVFGNAVILRCSYVHINLTYLHIQPSSLVGGLHELPHRRRLGIGMLP